MAIAARRRLRRQVVPADQEIIDLLVAAYAGEGDLTIYEIISTYELTASDLSRMLSGVSRKSQEYRVLLHCSNLIRTLDGIPNTKRHAEPAVRSIAADYIPSLKFNDTRNSMYIGSV